MLTDQQVAQEEEYDLPYHHLSAYAPTFQTGFIDSWAMNYNHTVEFVLEHLSRCRPNEIIDIGCGDGRLTREIRERFPATRVVGVDYSKRAISLAKAMDPDGVYESIDINELDNCFEFGLLVEVFEHIPPEQASSFVRGVARTVSTDGLLLVTVPHVNKPVEYKHFRHFTAETLCDCFAEYFVPEMTLYIERMGLANRLLNSLVVNRFFVLNNRWALDRIYRTYGRYVFRASSEDECARIAVLFRRNACRV